MDRQSLLEILNMRHFSDKVVLITGGTRGIGMACARRFLDEGARVALCGRSATSAGEASEHLGGDCRGYGCDVSDAEAVNALVTRVLDDFGALHVLINNAGVTHDGLLARMKTEHWHKVIETNLSGVFHCCRAAAKPMLRQRYGRIINIGSVTGIRGQAGQCNYAAAKAGLIGFSKAYAREVGSRNITVNVIAPGLIDTDMTAGMSEDMRAAAIEHIPAGRAGLPEEVAAAVAFFASDAAAYINGAVLPVDGGLGM